MDIKSKLNSILQFYALEKKGYINSMCVPEVLAAAGLITRVSDIKNFFPHNDIKAMGQVDYAFIENIYNQLIGENVKFDNLSSVMRTLDKSNTGKIHIGIIYHTLQYYGDKLSKEQAGAICDIITQTPNVINSRNDADLFFDVDYLINGLKTLNNI